MEIEGAERRTLEQVCVPSACMCSTVGTAVRSPARSCPPCPQPAQVYTAAVGGMQMSSASISNQQPGGQGKEQKGSKYCFVMKCGRRSAS